MMSQTLFERLGGKDAVNAAVDIFYKKVLADERVNGFFKQTDIEKQIAKQKAFMTYAFGGLETYTGKSMREAHQHLSLTEEHFNAIATHLKSTLEELNVPEAVQNEVLAIVGTTHDDVLNV